MKKLISLILCIFMLIIVFSLPAYAEKSYLEGADDWAIPGIIKSKLVVDDYFINGGLYNNYHNFVTREEFALVSYDLCTQFADSYAYEAAIMAAPFSDITSPAVNACYHLGIIEGVTKTTFEPKSNITREEMAVMIKRIADVVDFPLPEGDLSEFDDCDKISQWAKDDLASINAAGIMKGVSETKISPLTYVTKQELFTIIPRVYELLTGETLLIYEDSVPDVLVKLNIISQEDFEKGGHITNREALQTILKVLTIEPDENDLRYWYMIDDLEPLDYLDDEDKSLIISIRDHYIDTKDFFHIDFDKNASNLQALAYVTALVRQRSGCVIYPPSSFVENTSEVFENAIENGFIEETIDADAPVLRTDFYEFLRKALYIRYSNFGIVTTYERLIDRHTKKEEAPAEKVEEKKTITEISADVTINDDLSVTYKLPKEYEAIINSEFMVKYGLVTDGVEKGGTGNFFRKPMLEAYRFVEMLAKEENPDFLRITFTNSDYETKTSEIYYFDVDLSNFERIYTDEKITPGTYYHEEQKWPATKLTLAPGQMFQQGSYYILIGCESTYRKEEYNSTFYSAFRAPSTSNTFTSDLKRSFGVSAKDIYLQKITVKRENDKFTLYISPISEGTFKLQTM